MMQMRQARSIRPGIPIAVVFAGLLAGLFAGLCSGSCALAETPAGGSGATAVSRLVDDFERPARWTPHPADGVELKIGSDTGVKGRALRLDVNFTRGSGYAVARRAVSLNLPANYRFRFQLKSDLPPNTLEFKLIDSSGANVWWATRRDLAFPRDWEPLSIKKRQISFAWGPVGGGEIRHVAAIEIAITAGQGGRGTVWLDELVLEPLPPPDANPPRIQATASSAAGEGPAAFAVDGDSSTAWSSAPGDSTPRLTLDLGSVREFGGLSLAWDPVRRLRNYAIELSDDGTSFRTVRVVRNGGRSRDELDLPESEARFIRLAALGPPGGTRGVALREAVLQPLAYSATRSAFLTAIASRAPRGAYPRGFVGQQSYWTVVGLDADANEALLDEDGAIETGKGAWSIEPFIARDGHLYSWADGTSRQVLTDGDPLLPSVVREVAGLELTIRPYAIGKPGAASVYVQYLVRNPTEGGARAVLFLALRPLTVNPPTQFLNLPGGVGRIERIERRTRIGSYGRALRVNGRDLAVFTEPTGYGATTFDEGDVVADFLREGNLPPVRDVTDSTGLASAAIAFALDLPKRDTRMIEIAFALDDTARVLSPAPPPGTAPQPAQKGDRESWLAPDEPARTPLPPPGGGTGSSASLFGRSGPADAFKQRGLAHHAGIEIMLPEGARDVVETLWAQLGWIRINRDGPAIQPGSRSYERSWIRDGALTSSALLRLGQNQAAKDFARWFARYQYDDGKVPCCVDARGPDPVPEHDSHGEFIFLIAEVLRYTGDRAFADSLWPNVEKAATYLDRLRNERRTAEWRARGKEQFFGILPPSISHEGYSAKPMHSYWDDFFALRGFKDATYLAAATGRTADAERWDRVRAEFEHDLANSIDRAMKVHKIDYIPGSADLGDFDATSTTIALEPAEADTILPAGALTRTFERYWENFEARRSGREAWDAFTPYELRNVGAFIRLGWRDQAHTALDWFLTQRRPAGWKQWPEVVGSSLRTPRFLGDLPHTWVGSDYVRSVLDAFAYVRESDSALVVAAGVPWSWAAGEAGVRVGNLPTPLGRLGLRMRVQPQGLQVDLERGVRVPPGGIVVAAPAAPGASPRRRAIVNGEEVETRPDGSVIVRSVPVSIVLPP
ncbi:MAG: discoidin domain-containing protein [Candidatus Eiseniibacteriota bacterium]